MKNGIKIMLCVLSALFLITATGCDIGFLPNALKEESKSNPSSESAQSQNESLKGFDSDAQGIDKDLFGDWYSKNNPAVTTEAYYPKITLNSDYTFSFRINLYEGMGNSIGTYTVNGNTIVCVIKSKDFDGFIGDNLTQYVFRIDNNSLVYEGDYIGATANGEVFTR